MNNEFAQIYDCVRMIIRYSIVKCIKYRAIGWNKAKYVDVPGDIQQLPTLLRTGVWCKNLKEKSRYGISFKKTHPGCNLVLRSILQGGSLC